MANLDEGKELSPEARRALGTIPAAASESAVSTRALRPPPEMDEFEVRIREKTHGVLTLGEWVYLVGLFEMAREYDGTVERAETARNALNEVYRIVHQMTPRNEPAVHHWQRDFDAIRKACVLANAMEPR